MSYVITFDIWEVRIMSYTVDCLSYFTIFVSVLAYFITLCSYADGKSFTLFFESYYWTIYRVNNKVLVL